MRKVVAYLHVHEFWICIWTPVSTFNMESMCVFKSLAVGGIGGRSFILRGTVATQLRPYNNNLSQCFFLRPKQLKEAKVNICFSLWKQKFEYISKGSHRRRSGLYFTLKTKVAKWRTSNMATKEHMTKHERDDLWWATLFRPECFQGSGLY